MAGIDVSVAGVVALYDACTGFPVHSSSIQLLTDSDKEPLYKGSGVYVLINDRKTEINITAQVEGYHTFKGNFIIEKNTGYIPQKIIWLVPDKSYRGYREYTRIQLKAVQDGNYHIFIKCMDEQLRLSKEKPVENDRLRLFLQRDINYQERSILITDNNNKEHIRRLVRLIDENTCEYQINKALSQDVISDKSRIYKGYDVTSDNAGVIEFTVPYIVKEDTEFAIYNDTEKIMGMEEWRII